MLKLAWLNINRNTHRTLITMTSVLVAVFFCIMLNSVHKGIWNSSINSMLKMTGGHVEIHKKEFVQSKSIDDIMTMNRAAIDSITLIPHVQGVFPCLESFVLISHSSGNTSKGVALVGVVPKAEKQRLGLVTKIIEGKGLTETNRGILIGKNLSGQMKIGVGDSVIIIGKGYHGTSAVGMLPILGILEIPVANIDKSTIFTNLEIAQELFGAHNGYSSIYIMADQTDNVDAIKRNIGKILPAEEYEITDWRTSLGDFIDYSDLTEALGFVIKFFLYLLVGSNILGTIIMQTNERKQEFSMMIALGISRKRLCLSLFYELIIIVMSSVLVASIISFIIVYYFSGHPITLSGESADILLKYSICPKITLAISKELFINQILMVLCICMAVIMYPISVIRHLKVDMCQNKL
ncbi:ABC transporter permease [Prevotella sp. OH937_COT-195]|uniref:ABC transporter permease n=1 Tax=Prevotella sp. OH937_COT-195 TaxID=2491051 RepID=UPI000F650077|nr:FtsX-like permease family protein [Prevotella sp. OH937_COT-195]RRD02719.1 ABC transporter permease [Prevotella sp. OH937_COT-195]